MILEKYIKYLVLILLSSASLILISDIIWFYEQTLDSFLMRLSCSYLIPSKFFTKEFCFVFKQNRRPDLLARNSAYSEEVQRWEVTLFKVLPMLFSYLKCILCSTNNCFFYPLSAKDTVLSFYWGKKEAFFFVLPTAYSLSWFMYILCFLINHPLAHCNIILSEMKDSSPACWTLRDNGGERKKKLNAQWKKNIYIYTMFPYSTL